MSKKNNARLAAVLLAAAITLSPAVAAANNYGAIAFSAYSGAYGYSYDYGSRAGAESRALAECGGGCSVATWFRNACGALAVGVNNGWGADWGYSRAEAEAKALSICSGLTYNCAVRVWSCTTR